MIRVLVVMFPPLNVGVAGDKGRGVPPAAL